MTSRAELCYQANELRKRFGVEVSSPIDVFAILQSQERLTLAFYPFSNRISGMCICTRDGDQLIAINSTHSRGRQIFTAAHELYHLFVQDEITSVICGVNIGSSKDVEEKNADAFASYFIAPNDALRSFIEKTLCKGARRPLMLEDVVRIEQYFKMSRMATLYRLVEDKFISREFANNLNTNTIVSARRFGFSDELYTPTPEDRQYLTTGSYIDLVEQLNDGSIISSGKYEELLLEAYRADIAYNMEPAGQKMYD